MNELSRFGETVRTIRKKKGFSQEELADRSGLHRTYIGGIERGERNLSLQNIIALAEGLDCEIAELFIGLARS